MTAEIFFQAAALAAAFFLRNRFLTLQRSKACGKPHPQCR
jgi:hypothetical protein